VADAIRAAANTVPSAIALAGAENVAGRKGISVGGVEDACKSVKILVRLTDIFGGQTMPPS
jgi:hypothetical protein